MSDNFEDQYLDVLQNLEAAIAAFFDQHADISDASVDRALEALIRLYKADGSGKTVAVRLSETDQGLYQAIKDTVEWRLGRGQPLPTTATFDLHPELKTVDEMLACLKRIRKSVAFWTKEGGRQGYLNYIRQFLP